MIDKCTSCPLLSNLFEASGQSVLEGKYLRERVDTLENHVATLERQLRQAVKLARHYQHAAAENKPAPSALH